MEEAREKALQEVTDHYEAKLLERKQQLEQVRPHSDPWFKPSLLLFFPLILPPSLSDRKSVV